MSVSPSGESIPQGLSRCLRVKKEENKLSVKSEASMLQDVQVQLQSVRHSFMSCLRKPRLLKDASLSSPAGGLLLTLSQQLFLLHPGPQNTHAMKDLPILSG